VSLPTGTVAGGVLITLVLAACGTGSAHPSTLEPSPGFLPSADAFTSAVVATKALGTAHMDLDVTASSTGQLTHAAAAGPTVFGTGLGDLTWTTGTTTFRELVNERGIFRQDSPPNGPWVQQEAGQPTSTSGFADSLRGLGVMRDVTDEGADSLNGVATARYSGWIPLNATEAALLGMPTAHLGSPSDVGTAREALTVWVDGFGHIVRVDRRAPATGDPLVASSVSFDDFAMLLDLNTPANVVSTRSLD
jgi:hypothetical protein